MQAPRWHTSWVAHDILNNHTIHSVIEFVLHLFSSHACYYGKHKTYTHVNSNPTIIRRPKLIWRFSSSGWYTPALHIHHSIFIFTTPRLLLSRYLNFFLVMSVWTFWGLGGLRVGQEDNGVLLLRKNGWIGEQGRWPQLGPTPHARLPCVSLKMDWIYPFRWREHLCFSEWFTGSVCNLAKSMMILLRPRWCALLKMEFFSCPSFLQSCSTPTTLVVLLGNIQRQIQLAWTGHCLLLNEMYSSIVYVFF